jgi:hypothetical protein
MKLRALSILSGLALLAACSGSPTSSHSNTSDDTNGGSCQSPSDCSGALPRTEVQCSDGTFGGASWVCNSGTCTIEYCANDNGPAGSGGGGSGGCNAPSDCSGALPRTEVACQDGTYSGASWACNSGTCQVAYCVNDGGPASSGGGGGGGSSASCEQSSDCSGALPRNEIECADGSFGGASWTCDSGSCTIAYCANDGGPATSGGSDGGTD